MLVGFDAQAAHGRRTGLGVYTACLLEALERAIPETGLGFRVYKDTRASGRDWNTFERLLWENGSLPRQVRRDKIDILHIPAFAPAWSKPCRLVVTAHDIAGRLFPNQLGYASSFYWGTWLPSVIRKADRILADSRHTRDDLIRHLKIPETKIRVVYPSGHEAFRRDIASADIARLKERLGIRDNYFLFVGTFEPRKNLTRILAAFRKFCETRVDFQLVLAGSRDFAHGQYARVLEDRFGLRSDRIVSPGFLEHKDLNALYCGATALVFPSLYEGFGFPILEAMASGCPVITSQGTSLPEVAGEAAVLTDPRSEAEIEGAMSKISADPSLRDRLRRLGFERIKNFSWTFTAREVIKVYQSLT